MTLRKRELRVAGTGRALPTARLLGCERLTAIPSRLELGQVCRETDGRLAWKGASLLDPQGFDELLWVERHGGSGLRRFHLSYASFAV